MLYKYNKLVRDKIPEEINNLPGKKCTYTIMDEKTYDEELDKKLLEEANEYNSDHSIEELADLMEVIQAIMKFRNISQEELDDAMLKKRMKKGAFEKRIYLKEVEENQNEEEEINFSNKQKYLYDTLSQNNSITDVQNYIKSVIALRNLDKQKIENTMLLLTEEVGELAKAIRKDATQMKVDNNQIENYTTIESEIADVYIVLNSICNILDINLFKCILDKEKININRKWL